MTKDLSLYSFIAVLVVAGYALGVVLRRGKIAAPLESRGVLLPFLVLAATVVAFSQLLFSPPASRPVTALCQPASPIADAGRIAQQSPTQLTTGRFGGSRASFGYQAIFSPTDRLAAGTCYDVLTPVIRLSQAVAQAPATT